MMFPNNEPLKSIDNSFDLPILYKKRNINNKDLKESPPTPIIYNIKELLIKEKIL